MQRAKIFLNSGKTVTHACVGKKKSSKIVEIKSGRLIVWKTLIQGKELSFVLTINNINQSIN